MNAPTLHPSSTLSCPDTVPAVPRHVAIILDGNGRWATQRKLPRSAGHRRGVEAVRRVVEHCARSGVEYLTLFAFSSENWRRPSEEVSLLMRLFVGALQREVRLMHDKGIRLRVVGDRSRFEPMLQRLIESAEERTADNDRLTLTIAANYGGRWDLLQATRALIAARIQGRRPVDDRIDEAELADHLALSFAPEPDLFIRTGGEQRISNFLLWQLAYTELYFCEQYWPDFDAGSLELAFDWYRGRERRFGRTSGQLAAPVPGRATAGAG